MRPSELASRLALGPLLLDGGLGSMLIAAGIPPGAPPERWVLERPDAVAAVHRGYVEAGCDVVHAATFGANAPRLAAAGLTGRCREVNAAAITLARAECGQTVLVAGDVGPTGLMLPPLGSATAGEIGAVYLEQCEALAAAGADLVSIETVSDLREALAAVAAARSTGLAVIASLTFEARRRGAFTIMGDPLVASLRALVDAGAHAVGCNCSVTSAEMLEMVREAAPQLTAPLVAQPNAGRPRVTPDGVEYDADPSRFATGLAAMVACGARAVGGCCGTTPAHLAAAREALGGRARA